VSTYPSRIRLGAIALAAAGILFVLYPVFRPWRDESMVDGATAAMSSGAWVASHFFAMIGFILIPLALLALRQAAGVAAERLAFAAVVTGSIGAGLILPYYGAETYGLHAIAGATDQPLDLLELVDAVRYQPAAASTFGIGLLALGVAAVLAAVAVQRSGVLPRYSGIPFALGFALFLPQFFLPAGARIGHGVLVGIGCAWLAHALWSAAGRTSDAPPAPGSWASRWRAW
jgi:hypothetical protein